MIYQGRLIKFSLNCKITRRSVDFRGPNQLIVESLGLGRWRMGGVFYPAEEYRLVMECPVYGIRIEAPRSG